MVDDPNGLLSVESGVTSVNHLTYAHSHRGQLNSVHTIHHLISSTPTLIRTLPFTEGTPLTLPGASSHSHHIDAHSPHCHPYSHHPPTPTTHNTHTHIDTLTWRPHSNTLDNSRVPLVRAQKVVDCGMEWAIRCMGNADIREIATDEQVGVALRLFSPCVFEGESACVYVDVCMYTCGRVASDSSGFIRMGYCSLRYLYTFVCNSRAGQYIDHMSMQPFRKRSLQRW
jgi:hypothetical protein